LFEIFTASETSHEKKGMNDLVNPGKLVFQKLDDLRKAFM